MHFDPTSKAHKIWKSNLLKSFVKDSWKVSWTYSVRTLTSSIQTRWLEQDSH